MPGFEEDDHPRDESGKFSSGGGGGKDPALVQKWAQARTGSTHEVARELTKQMSANPHGFSWRHDKGNPTTGIMVAEHSRAGHAAIIDLGAMRSEAELHEAVHEWVKKVLPNIHSDVEKHLGGWSHEGKFYLDLAHRWPKEKEKEAVEAGKANNQKAIWHIDRGEEIQTGGTGEL
jgi:hypothetical protein